MKQFAIGERVFVTFTTARADNTLELGPDVPVATVVQQLEPHTYRVQFDGGGTAVFHDDWLVSAEAIIRLAELGKTLA